MKRSGGLQLNQGLKLSITKGYTTAIMFHVTCCPMQYIASLMNYSRQKMLSLGLIKPYDLISTSLEIQGTEKQIQRYHKEIVRQIQKGS